MITEVRRKIQGIFLREIKFEFLNHSLYLQMHSKFPKTGCDLHVKSITTNHKILFCERKKESCLVTVMGLNIFCML